MDCNCLPNLIESYWLIIRQIKLDNKNISNNKKAQ